jgi:hypothetical protein
VPHDRVSVVPGVLLCGVVLQRGLDWEERQVIEYWLMAICVELLLLNVVLLYSCGDLRRELKRIAAAMEFAADAVKDGEE